MNELHVIFGTGPIGKSVMRELLKQGKPVRIINRSGKADMPPRVELAQGDAYNAETVRKLTRDATVVYQCAQPPYPEWQEKFPPLQASILEGTAANGAKLIITENLYMYGEVSGLIREDLAYAATTRKGRVRAQLAEAALAAHRSGKVRVVLARGSNYIGPEGLDSAIGQRAIYPALEGK